jgi:hypothetical protein
MINRFRRFPAINAGFVSKRMEILSPATNTKFGAQILKENRIPGVHPLGSVAESLPAVAGMSMCRAMQFSWLIALLAGGGCIVRIGIAARLWRRRPSLICACVFPQSSGAAIDIPLSDAAWVCGLHRAAVAL